MRNHDEKVKDMGRSVLPSKWREGARWTRRKIQKQRRARANLRTAIARRSEADRRRRPMPRRLLLGDHDAQAFARETAVSPQARTVVAAVAAMAGRR